MVSNGEELSLALENLENAQAIGLDTETTGLDPYRSALRLLQLSSPTANYVIDLFELPALQNQRLRELLTAPRPIKVGHNIRFDLKFLWHHAGIRLQGLFDTMLADQLITAGLAGISHSLAAVAQRHLSIELDKLEQRSDWSSLTGLTESQLEYAARDVAVLLPLREQLISKIKELRLVEVTKLEFDCVAPIGAMELAGMHLDTGCWDRLVENVRREHDRLAAELRTMLTIEGSSNLFGEFDINLDSPQQVVDALNRLGISVRNTNAGTLQPYAGQHPVVAKLLDYRAVQKSLTSYGENILEFVHPVTGRLHPNFRQIGTPTGRLSCSDPNLQQIPASPEYRRCFSAPAGRKMIIADYSQIELRIVADWSGDTALTKAFVAGADLHKLTASQMFGIPLDLVGKTERSAAKALNFGIIYGMGAQGLAARIGLTVPHAEELIKKYFKTYSGIAAWLREASDTAVRERKCRTRAGRLIHFGIESDDRAALAMISRMGKNSPIQGTSADITKRALSLLLEALKIRDAKIVNCVHDEIVVEAAESQAADVAEIVRTAMVSAGCQYIGEVPVEVETIVGDAWLK